MSSDNSSLLIGGGIAYTIFMIIFCVYSIICLWKIFEKAGYEGWKCIIPFYNMYCWFEMVWGKGIAFLLLCIPIVNFVIAIMFIVRLARSFGLGAGMIVALLLVSPIAMGIIAFNNNIQYIGPNGVPYDDDCDYD